jgi:hypothetical protein
MSEDDGKLRVFISWSGDLANDIAHHLKSFLPKVIQSLDPWISDESISKGSFWQNEIMKGLKNSRVGLIVLTQENVARPWLHYEAGYMARYIDSGEGLVSPILFNVSNSKVVGPMRSLQTTDFSKADLLKLMKDINKLTNSLDANLLEETFSTFWNKFDHAIKESIGKHKRTVSLKKEFDQEGALTEILDTVRALASRSIDPDELRWLATATARREFSSRNLSPAQRRLAALLDIPVYEHYAAQGLSDSDMKVAVEAHAAEVRRLQEEISRTENDPHIGEDLAGQEHAT